MNSVSRIEVLICMGLSAVQFHLCFDTLSNELRMRILEELAKKPLAVEELAKKLNAERSRISHSLQLLRECNYVSVEKIGKKRVYSIKKGVVEGFSLSKKEDRIRVFDLMKKHVKEFCCNNCNRA